MEELAGISASPGVAIGEVFLYLDDDPTVPHYQLDAREVDAERQRFNDAVTRAREEIEALKEDAREHAGDRQRQLLDSHLLMLSDREFLGEIEERLKSEQCNVEWVLQRTMQDLVDRLGGSEDLYLRERTSDLHDVSKRILSHLMYQERLSLADLEREVILVTRDLLPSDAVAMNKRMVKGIAMDAGGRTSHSAILARSFEIPSVVGLTSVSSRLHNGDRLIIDGNRGRVILRPDERTEQRYLRIQREWRKREVQLMGLNDLPAETKDGKLIRLDANIEVPDEVDAILSHGADGVGLFRSEFLFLSSGHLPSEEEQYEAYRQVLTGLGKRPVTIRTLDIGGDKVAPELEGLGEPNPILGWRAIRFCLSRPELFRTQLRALFRASTHGMLRIMFPMISGLDELVTAYQMADQVRAELRAEGHAVSDNVPIGIMIEVPAAAMTADILARKADFFSIGTNDLIQYTIAVDRGNEKTAYLYEPFHPGVIRLIKTVVDSGHSAGIPVGMCGEMAGDPVSTALLVGLGLDEFSMSASSIPEVKRIIRDLTIAESEELLGKVMEMGSAKKIDGFVQDVMERRFDVHVYE
jgi:phosphotransferase system enzyme I (PtsI)